MDLTRFPLPLKAFIGGKYVDSLGNERKSLQSSLDDRIVTDQLQWSNAEDVDYAVAESEKGLVAWQAMSKEAKRAAMLKFADLLEEHKEQLHWLDAIVSGKDYFFGQSIELSIGAELWRYYAARVDDFQSEVLLSTSSTLAYTLRQPYGITAGIVPYNGPMQVFCMKVAAALAAGNVITIKTSELNPLAPLFAASLTVQAGFPAGVINVLTGGPAAGNALASHPKIRKISFTGSVAVGKLVQVAAAKSNLKSVTLELGGKSPSIVFPDADLDQAAQASTAFFLMSGQGCALATRLYVHRDVAKPLLAKLKRLVEEHEKTLGSDPLSPSTMSSPLYNHQQKKTVMEFIESGQAQAELFHGGSGTICGGKGAYVQPTIFVNPKPDARVLKEEIFGPVLTVVEFDNEDEVLAMANDSELGLAANVFTASIPRALRFAQELQAGTIGVNMGMYMRPLAPFGGWKQSGQGLENGRDGLLDWTLSKTVNIVG